MSMHFSLQMAGAYKSLSILLLLLAAVKQDA
jgi:hypothetical protein